MQHVIAATEVTRFLDRVHVVGLLHYADHPIRAVRVLAGPADLAIGDGVAERTGADTVEQLAHGSGEATRVVLVAAQQVKRDPLRGLRPDAR